jgi:hypothetical protein
MDNHKKFSFLTSVAKIRAATKYNCLFSKIHPPIFFIIIIFISSIATSPISVLPNVLNVYAEEIPINATGLTNDSGLINATGLTNDFGLINATGLTNDSGLINATGLTNDFGLINATGLTNDFGLINATGLTNDFGLINATGFTNATGLTNATSDTNDTGLTNATSDTNDTGLTDATKSWQFDSTLNGTKTIGNTKVEQTSNVASLKLTGEGYLQQNLNSTRTISALTLSAWVKPDYSQGSPQFTVISKENAFVLAINNNLPPSKIAIFSVFDGIKWQTVNSTIPISENWTHLAATFNGTTISIYVNGTLQSTLVLSGTPSINVNGKITSKTVDELSANTDTIIGASYSTTRESARNLFSGSIEEVNLYDSFLSSSQIAQIYNKDFGNR